jgi:death-on-curing protein
MTVHFIPDDLVLVIHADLLQRYGGRPGLRDRGLLESALAQPWITVGGKFAHKTLFEKAAAYGFHLCRKRPFVDGNKRVAFVLMDLFLQKNDWELVTDEEEGYSTMIAFASGRLTKAELTSWLKKHSLRLPR